MFASRHQMGVPIFLLLKARKKRLRAAPFGAAIRLLGHSIALQGWVYRSARCRPPLSQEAQHRFWELSTAVPH